MASFDSNSEPAKRRWLRPLRWLLVITFVGLACGYAATRWLVSKAEQAYPLLGETVELDGLEQHFVERGSGSPIVFVHGAFGASQDFVQTVIPELSSRYRCIAWDRPGHGYSERPNELTDPGVQARMLLALIRKLELDRPLLVGFSYGGAVTLAAALEDSSALRGVVLLNGPSHTWPDPLDFHYELPALPLIGGLVTETLLMPIGRLAIESSAAHAFAPLEVPKAFENSPVLLSLRPDSYRANAEDIRALKPFLRTQSEHYGELDLPLMMLVSEGDLVVSPTIHSPALHAAAPQSSMLRIEGAGHQILYTHPETVIAAIDSAM